MSTSAIEKLLQVIPRPGSTSTRLGAPDSNVFREHLQRASVVATPTQRTLENHSSSPVANDGFEEPALGQDTLTEQQGDASEAVQEIDQNEVEAGDSSEKEEAQDDVTLSEEAVAALAAQSEIPAEPQGDPSSIVGVSTTVDSSPEANTVEDAVPIQITDELAGRATAGGASSPPGQEETATRQTPTDAPSNAPTDAPADAISDQVRTTAVPTAIESRAPGPEPEAVPRVANDAERNPASSEPGASQSSLAQDPSATELAPTDRTHRVATRSKRPSLQDGPLSSSTTPPSAEGAESLSTNEPAAPKLAPATNQAAASTPATAVDTSAAARGLQHAVAPASAAPPEAPAKNDSTAPVDRARFVQRVSGAFRAAQERDGQIHLRLSPPELGTLRIEIAVKQGVLTARLETESAAARNLLLDNLPALRERLAEQEIRVEKFDVDVRDESGKQDNQTEGRNQESTKTRTASTTESNKTSREQEPVDGILSAPTSPTTIDGGLDVMI